MAKCDGHTIRQFAGEFKEYATALCEMLVPQQQGPQALVLCPSRYMQLIEKSFDDLPVRKHEGMLCYDPSGHCQGSHIKVASLSNILAESREGTAPPLNSVRLLILYEADDLMYGTYCTDLILKLLQPACYKICVLYRSMISELKFFIDTTLYQGESCNCVEILPASGVPMPRSLEHTVHFLVEVQDSDSKLQTLYDRMRHFGTTYFTVVYCNNGSTARKICLRLREFKLTCFSSQRRMRPELRERLRSSSGQHRAYRCIVADHPLPEWPCSMLVVFNFDVPSSAHRYFDLVAGTLGRNIVVINLATPQEEPALRHIETELGFNLRGIPRGPHGRIHPNVFGQFFMRNVII